MTGICRGSTGADMTLSEDQRDSLIHIALHWTMRSQLLADARPGSDEHGFVLHFRLAGQYPQSRLHEAISPFLAHMTVDWIVARRQYWQIDLDGAKRALPEILKSSWITGRVKLEPEVVERPAMLGPFWM